MKLITEIWAGNNDSEMTKISSQEKSESLQIGMGSQLSADGSGIIHEAADFSYLEKNHFFFK